MLTYVVLTLIVFIIASFIVYTSDPEMPPAALLIIAGASLLWPVAAVAIGVAAAAGALFLIRLKKDEKEQKEQSGIFDDRDSL